jgi:hypothetical protein
LKYGIIKNCGENMLDLWIGYETTINFMRNIPNLKGFRRKHAELPTVPLEIDGI